MGDLGRTVLIWIVAMLMPLQGMASASGFLCAPGHHAAGSVAGSVSEPAHVHHHAGAGVATSVVAQDGAVSPHPAEDRCSACSACCAGAVLPTSPVTLASVVEAGRVQVAPDGGAASIVGCGPERPPRA